MTRVLVVGGSGFIGSRLASRLLELGHEVALFDKAPSMLHAPRLVRGDVRDAAALADAVQGFDCIVALAAEHRDDVRPESLYHDVNVGGAANLVRAAAIAGVRRIVFVSSVAVYGLDQPLADEAAPLRPAGAYGHSKVLAERIHEEWADAGPQRSLLVLRPVVVFGEGNRGNVHTLAEQLRRGRFAMVGSGRNHKAIAYVGNLVEFIARHLEGPPGRRVLNYADPPDFRSGDLVARLCELLGRPPPSWRLPYAAAHAAAHACDAVAWCLRRPLPISVARVRKFCARTQVSIAALEATGFERPLSLDEGLARMVAAMRAEADQS
ncbi:MAG: NAD-dependent epimerase/dehydratase family protein [Dokdonella sp.]|uniref:NAD-dependent epimerase/dehydratase family protein n=1 Tax=Dokdonella sp. TaxID=2291710 RepID=UPI003F814202